MRTVQAMIIAAIGATNLSAQDVPLGSLTQPVAVLQQGFTRIGGIRELQDGRVILLDIVDRSVHAVAADLSVATPVGRTGSGPGEYRLPSRLFALTGDTTAVLDAAMGRLLLIAPDGQPANVVDLRHGIPATRVGFPLESDARGRFYSQAAPISLHAGGTPSVVDSAAVQRWIPGSQPDTVAFVSVDRSRYRLAGGIVAASPLQPFAPAPRWTVSTDGVVAVVYPLPFRVTFYEQGLRREGPAIQYQQIRVTERHKQAYREEMQRPRPMVVYQRGEASSGVRTMSMPFREPDRWPEYMPPFTSNAPLYFAPDGALWLERASAAPDEQPVYDVIDRTGQPVQRVVVPRSTRLVGFGSKHAYLVRRDEVELEYLERYLLPRIAER